MSDAEDRNDDEALAAEYVLRLLSEEDRAAFEARLKDEPALRDLVLDWEAQFAGMADEVEEIAPPPRVKAGVLKAVSPSSARRPGFWAMLLGGLAAAGLAAILIFGGGLFEPSGQPRLTAELVSEDGAVVLVAGVAADTQEIVVEQRSGRPPEGHVFELWLIAEGAEAPVSLGVLEAGRTTRLALPAALAPSVPTGVLAVSEEPPGGSPTGAPTGAVVATARLASL
ncbi:anti-sigma factor [Limimaricola pyoseonensis]|uniref:Regulator of SigK n=1 Tax=Limimaricola pyoseonensis TaxID=521013 RepID=A0A1G7JK74_9RHOB|nr:anti-sigma factor [Limimaricola pyoseonensis]SDF25362.1 Anti-sigma-K factor RskA [Limimaricola pyoseonensis]